MSFTLNKAKLNNNKQKKRGKKLSFLLLNHVRDFFVEKKKRKRVRRRERLKFRLEFFINKKLQFT